MIPKLKEYKDNYQKILQKKEELFQYQDSLELGHRQLEIFDNLERTMTYYHKIWEQRVYYFDVNGRMMENGYGMVSDI